MSASTFRRLTWGKTPAQYNTFKLCRPGASGGTCRSMIVDHSSGNLDAAAGLYNYSDPNPVVSSNADGATRWFRKIPMAQLRAQLGHSPTLIRATYNMRLAVLSPSPSPSPLTIGLYRLLRQPTWDSALPSNRYYDGTNPWGGDAGLYAPYPGIDHLAEPFSTFTVPGGTTDPQSLPWDQRPLHTWDITSEMKYCLAAGVDLLFMVGVYPIGSSVLSGYTSCTYNNDAGVAPGYLSYFDFWYLNQVEFFAAKANGAIDQLTLLNNQYDLAQNALDLGSAERGEISTPVKFFLANLGTRTRPHIELWDDTPEWTKPVAGSGNAGNAALAYVVCSESAATSQAITIKFTSPTAFQVQSLAYRDNGTDLHASFAADVGWNGTVGADLILGLGGVTIPTAAWSGTAVANDTIIVYITGQSTDYATWPADSNAQVDMAKDSAGSPDAATWRNIKMPRTTLDGALTVNNTGTITITTLTIAPADYPAGRKIAVANATTIDYGTVQAGATATSIPIQFDSATNNVYAAGAKVTCALVARSLGMKLWALSTGAAGAGQSNAAVIPLTGAQTKGFTAASTIVIQGIESGTQEEATIASVSDTQITCSALLANAYSTGAFVVQAGAGEVAFWNRIDSLLSTAQELKRYRLNVRT